MGQVIRLDFSSTSKKENILYDKNDKPVIIDLGSAKENE